MQVSPRQTEDDLPAEDTNQDSQITLEDNTNEHVTLDIFLTYCI